MVQPVGTTWQHHSATVVPLFNMLCNHLCKGGTTVAPLDARVVPRGATWYHLVPLVVAPRCTTRWCHFFLCLQTIQQSTEMVVPPQTGMVCGIPTSRSKFILLTPKKKGSSLGGPRMREDRSWGSEDPLLPLNALYSVFTVERPTNEGEGPLVRAWGAFFM